MTKSLRFDIYPSSLSNALSVILLTSYYIISAVSYISLSLLGNTQRNIYIYGLEHLLIDEKITNHVIYKDVY